MATKPTIYKARISLNDIDRNVFDNLDLTIARHPSETVERMMVRILAYCLNAREGLVFCKGVSASEEADLWAHELDGTLALWIDVGEPAVDRVRKARRVARAVTVYTFNSKSSVWWSQNREALAALDVAVCRFDWSAVQDLAAMVTRTMDMNATISGGTVWLGTENGDCELSVDCLQEPKGGQPSR